jgi:hypothetical protein
MRASTGDIYGILNSILVEQKKGQRPLKFSVDRETLHCLSTDQEKAMKDLMALNSSTVDSLPPPAHSMKSTKLKKAALSDGDQFDFSPNIPGNVTPGPPTTPHIFPDSKLLIYTENVSSQKFSANFPSPPSPERFSPSLQSSGSAPLEIQPNMGSVTHAPPQPEADNVHGTRLMLSSPQATKRKDRLDDSNSNSPPPLLKKRKTDMPAPAVKKPNTKTQKKSRKNEQAMAGEAGAGGESTSSSTVPVVTVGVTKDNAKLPPAPRERSQR